ncbi:MFS transporter [Streptomyces himalayensis]|uniref:MFS transporter n=1 Tax=Streptomyces himalayensis TaxID=2820085 RepID=UPI0028B03CC8|nr:MFS transporter [Streptomyces himalayensis]
MSDTLCRQEIAVGCYTTTAVLGAATAGATAVWQVGLLRAAAWTTRGLRVPARNTLLADIVPAKAHGLERMMDNLGAIFGPLLALGLVTGVGVQWAIGLSVIPGLLAAAAIVYAIRKTPRPTSRDKIRRLYRWSPRPGQQRARLQTCGRYSVRHQGRCSGPRRLVTR